MYLLVFISWNVENVDERIDTKLPVFGRTLSNVGTQVIFSIRPPVSPRAPPESCSRQSAHAVSLAWWGYQATVENVDERTDTKLPVLWSYIIYCWYTS